MIDFSILFQSLLMAIGTAFLYHVDDFKIYSTYCANHSKAQKALHQSKNTEILQLWSRKFNSELCKMKSDFQFSCRSYNVEGRPRLEIAAAKVEIVRHDEME